MIEELKLRVKAGTLTYTSQGRKQASGHPMIKKINDISKILLDAEEIDIESRSFNTFLTSLFQSHIPGLVLARQYYKLRTFVNDIDSTSFIKKYTVGVFQVFYLANIRINTNKINMSLWSFIN